MTLIVASLSKPIEELAQSHPITAPKSKRSSSSSLHLGSLPLASFTAIATEDGIKIPQGKAQTSINHHNHNNGSINSDSHHNSPPKIPSSSVEDLFYPLSQMQSGSTSPKNVKSILSHYKSSNLTSANISTSSIDLTISPKQFDSIVDLKSGLDTLALKKQLSASSSSSSVFIPKSRVASPPASSVFDSVNSKKFDVGLPSVKRTRKHSILKYQTDDDAAEDFDARLYKFDDHELEDDYDSGRHHDIPTFGGFSKKSVLNKEEKTNIFEKAPFNVVEYGKGNGGLKNAIKSAVAKEVVKDYKWLGTIGIPTDELPETTKSKITTELRENFHSESVLPDDITFQGHYKNFCKQILWPTFHYQIPDNPKSKAFEDHSWKYYNELNRNFADKIIEIYNDGDVIWIHDYHLLLVPQMVREALPNAEIGFFLHVSFPSSEVFRCLAQREKLLLGMLGANTIHFQTTEYVRHFLQTCNKLILSDISKDELRHKGKSVKVMSDPLGIDVHDLQSQLATEEVETLRELVRERWAGKFMILARDKFDRIRGVKQRLLAYEMFLKANPKRIDDTVLIQISPKEASTDTVLEGEIMSVADRINAMSSNISDSPSVVFFNQDIEFSQYLALLSEANAFIVSSMREGMNLTCHEFVVATSEKKSPLILSEFTGSAGVFTDGSFLINPWDLRDVAKTFEAVHSLSKSEKENNWRKLFDVVNNLDCDKWVSSCLSTIHSSWEYQQQRQKYSTLDVREFAKYYNNAPNGKRLFVILQDYIPNERILKIMSDLTLQAHHVYVLSTFSIEEIDRIYARIPRLGFIGEAGGYIKVHNGGKWTKNYKPQIQELLSNIAIVAQSYAERLPGSYVQVSSSMVKFHVEQVKDEERKQSTVGDLIAHVNSSSETDLHATFSKDIVYIQEPNIALSAFKWLYSEITLPGSAEELSIASVPVSPVISSYSEYSGSNITGDMEFMTVVGEASDMFDNVLEYANFMSGKIDHVYTISYGDGLSSATDHVEGLNDLFNVFAFVMDKRNRK
ncbi:hypothetical protein WICPIJ_006915 [Wickerhamomyces pijperi]|uniref:Alpha,alpha-trehalose-phosphate synthase (UDP-forming) n=1 Tax=Wickerhamomyces pijperi TaxID=599730 RepID=A0A9P8Q0U5_WICPI|nr:hypothetical protein WICPIJ_006915 [Wickerhamomyces pijperi]